MVKRGQIWVETVIYVLIGLVILGIVLASSMPKIKEGKDRLVIEQIISALSDVDGKIYETGVAPWNKRIVQLTVSSGEFYVDPENDEIGWILDSSYAYSEVDKDVVMGKINVLTSNGSPYRVKLSIKYVFDISSGESSNVFKFASSPNPYRISIENKGIVDGKTKIDIIVV